MKTMKCLLVILLAMAATSWTVAVPTSARETALSTQNSTALERGYRTGYSDGYQAGYKDQTDRASRDYASKAEYQHADRAYVEAWGPVEDYRDGYQQGYELGYGAGFDRQAFNSTLPSGFKRRGSANQQNDQNGAQTNSGNTSTDPNQSNQSNPPVNTPANMSGNISIPRDTTLLVELENGMSTEDSHRGDPFQARVVEPREFAGALVEGKITRVQRAGKLKGTAELQLSFEQIKLPDNRSANFHAEVVEVLPNGGSTGVGDVDREGGVKGQGSTKDDVTKIGAATGIGAIIGAIAGGGKGAAIGAAIGGSVGTAGVISTRGKDLRLARGQQLKIRTLTDTGIQ